MKAKRIWALILAGILLSGAAGALAGYAEERFSYSGETRQAEEALPLPAPAEPASGESGPSVLPEPGKALEPAAHESAEVLTAEGLSAQQAVDLDYEALTLDALCKVPPLDGGVVLDSLRLPAVGANGSEILWQSDTPAVLSSAGILKRGAERKLVTLTALLRKGDYSRPKTFAITVPARREEIDGMPVPGNVLRSDNFEDGVIDSSISAQSAGAIGTVTEENGVLKLTRQANGGDNAVFLTYPPNKMASGDFITEFTLNKQNGNQTIWFRSWGDGDLFRVDWTGDGHIHAYFSDSPGGNGYDHDLGELQSDVTAKFTIYYELTQGKVSLWVNNRLAVNRQALNKAGTYLNGITVYNVSADALPNGMTIDDYSYHLPMADMPDQERVEKDLETLTYDRLFKSSEGIDGFISQNIDLPNAGANGSDIVWESSDEALVGLDGVVTRPLDGHATVILTASVISGGVREVREFTLRILNAQAEPDDLPKIREMIYENDFSDNTRPSNITLESSDGGSTAIRDGALVLDQPAGGYCRAVINFSEDSTALTGLVGVEYTLEQTGWGQWQQFFIKGGAWSYYARLFYYGDGNTHLRYRNEDGSQGEYFGNYPGSYHIRLLFDTDNNRFSAWINDQLAVQNVLADNETGRSIFYMQFMTGNRTYDCTCRMDNLKVYYADPPTYSIASLDSKWLTDSIIRTAPYVTGNIIDTDLNLITEGKYGSLITWQSSHPDIIEEDGTVHFPKNMQSIPEVTLTATISAYGFEFERSFTFGVLRGFDTQAQRLEGELQDLTYQLLTNEPPDRVTSALNLRNQGLYGSSLQWSSSDPLVITNAGRVVRPRWDSEDREVTLTATVTDGEASRSRDYSFTVLADAEYTDPQYMTDEEFFGKWSGSGWEITGKLDYGREGLKAVEAAVRGGDYAVAKEALLTAMRSRTDKTSITPAVKREPGWAEMRISDIYSLQESKYYQGQAVVSAAEYETIAIPVMAGTISAGGMNTYAVISRYNESSSATIASRENPKPALRPRLELVVNGQSRTYEADGDAAIRAGEYRDVCYGTAPELTAKMSGEFLGGETYKALIRFHFDDLLESDTVTSARLILNAKTESQYQCSKELIVLYEPNNTWDESTVCWDSMPGYVYNYNGLSGRNDWENIADADAEYLYQSTRFFGWDLLAAEYQYTRDEKYAYYMISDMMDFIWDKGQMMYNNGSNWGGQNIRGGYPRTLDTSIRLQNQIPALPLLFKSQYMTSEICTAILKNIWDMADSLTRSKSSTGNWVQHEQKGILHGGLSFPEFTKSRDWFESALARSEGLIYDNHFDDGSYIEGTGGYSQSAFGDFVDLKALLIDNGLDVSKEYNEMLHKAGYYNMLLNGPGGTSLQYGDQQGGSSYGDRRPELANWFGDDELAFVSSFYQRGKEPDWTSKLFPDSRLSLLRSDWSKNALFAFTHVRGGGQHAHADDNSMVVMAYQRTLLNDAGISSYDESDPQRIWFKSTRAHNTVEINNLSQNIGSAGKNFGAQGSIHNWVSNRRYDFISQSTKSYTGFDHRRTITFVKPDLWIVSDLMAPEDETSRNEYKQIWHMPPNADLQTDANHNTIFSNYKNGANIILASADQDAEVTEEMGWYDYGYHQVTEAKYAYFGRAGVKGKAGFDTVLLPYRNVGGASVSVTRLETGAPVTEATAMRLETVVDGTANTMHYLLDYEPDAAQVRTFGSYRTNGTLALVREDAQGHIKEVILNQADGLETSDGLPIVELEDTYGDFSFEVSGDKLVVDTSQDTADPSKIRLKIADRVRNAEFNGKTVAFTQQDGYLTLTDQPAAETPDLDGSQGGGIVDRPSGSGGNGGGGGNGGSSSTPEPTSTPPVELPGFSDIAGHWAEADILCAAEKGVVQGEPDGRYRPDDPVSRAELVTVMMRAAEIPQADYAQSYSDVTVNDWFAPWIQAALYAGFVAQDQVFRPNDPITREEMSKLVTALHKRLNPSGHPADTAELSYLDQAAISDWAIPFVKYTAAYGLMQGDADGSFRPGGSASRAEMAAVLSRILKE